MTLQEVLRRSTEHLTTKGLSTPRLDAELLLAHALGLTRIELYMALDRVLTAAELDAARVLVARRARREPLQYVLGEWGFRRLVLSVDRRALIPRPETEILVERGLALLAGREAPRVLDVGTGAGAVALAIADEHPGARVTGIDVSEQALALAAENAATTGLERRARLPRPLRRASTRAVGSRRLESALRPRGRARRARARGARLGASARRSWPRARRTQLRGVPPTRSHRGARSRSRWGRVRRRPPRRCSPSSDSAPSRSRRTWQGAIASWREYADGTGRPGTPVSLPRSGRSLRETGKGGR